MDLQNYDTQQINQINKGLEDGIELPPLRQPRLSWSGGFWLNKKPY